MNYESFYQLKEKEKAMKRELELLKELEKILKDMIQHRDDRKE